MVGIGDNDFSLLEFLDSDNERLIDKCGRVQQRDNLQFVEQNLYKHSQVALKHQILNELPDQIENYMGYKNMSAKHIDKIYELWIKKFNNLDNLNTTLETKKKYIHNTTLNKEDI